MRKLLADILGTLEDLAIDPAKLQVELQVGDIWHVTITFRTVADITAYAKADKAKVDTRNLTQTYGHYEHSALYDRSGRRMLLICRVLRHSPDWPEGGAG